MSQMEPTLRRQLGAFYTPSEVVEPLLDACLNPVIRDLASPEDLLAIRVVDPSCGDGAFLGAAARRIATRLVDIEGGGIDEAVARVVHAGCVQGADIDPAALDACAAVLGSDAHLRLGDALLQDDLFHVEPDVVVGNPPFLNQLDRRTTVTTERRLALQDRYPMDAYTDLAAVFLLRAVRMVRAGGRVAMIQPLSVLAARDAQRIREAVSEEAALTYLWVAGGRVFPDANTQVCAIGAVRGGAEGSVRLVVGGGFREVGDVPSTSCTSWASLGARAMGVPAVAVEPGPSAGTVADMATVTADFRDAFYQLAGVAREGDATVTQRRIATTGLVDPAVIRWGEQEVRFAGDLYRMPVAGTQVPDDPALARWIAERAVPKVLVATQTRVLEAAIDAEGAYLPVTPLISVMPNDVEDLGRIAALLSSPVATAIAATESFGTALSPLAIKVSASLIRSLPLPTDASAWDEAAAIVLQAHGEVRMPERLRLLERAGRAMLDAYGLPAGDPSFAWWVDRLRSGSRRRSLRPGERAGR